MAKLHAELLEPGSAIMALEQTAGKGQRGKEWIASPGANITMSTVFSPSASLSPEASAKINSFPFLLSAAMALACYDFIKAYQIDHLSIKWPNDLYIGDRKAAGILIENSYRGTGIEWSVVGTGINLNQTSFANLQHKAISLAAATGRTYPLLGTARQLHVLLNERFNDLNKNSPEQIMTEYNTLLYRRGEQVKLKKGNIVFNTTIVSVSVDGELITKDNMERRFKVGEIELVSV